ncbi:unnamed protein product [Thlaspi arvense]|uniref:C2H2-type domain-containing protein n=1 Tax=Thlaspi arvense TaxID=13288 RepID=A0AAU9T3E6_THLAR|nr:unnamed protein product [Thlaspi arvense]
MSNPEKMKVDDTATEEEKENSDEQRNDEEFDMREIVLGLPALRISSEAFGVSVVGKEEEARLNEQAVVAAQLVMAAADEAVMKERSDGKKKVVRRPRKKLNFNDEAGGSGPNVGVDVKKPKKKASVLTNPPRGPPICHICGRRFGSWKGVFGHMRCHKDRNYQGFLPPPKFSPVRRGFTIPGPNSSFVLFSAGGGSSVGFIAGGAGSAGGASGGAPGGDGGRGLEIDLNVDPVEEDEDEVIEAGGGVAKFDLNKPPPEDDEEADKAK